MDILGQILFYLAFITPLFTIPFTRKILDKEGPYVFIGLIMAVVLSLLLFFASVGICFRNGMGPV